MAGQSKAASGGAAWLALRSGAAGSSNCFCAFWRGTLMSCYGVGDGLWEHEPCTTHVSCLLLRRGFCTWPSGMESAVLGAGAVAATAGVAHCNMVRSAIACFIVEPFQKHCGGLSPGPGTHGGSQVECGGLYRACRPVSQDFLRVKWHLIQLIEAPTRPVLNNSPLVPAQQRHSATPLRGPVPLQGTPSLTPIDCKT